MSKRAACFFMILTSTALLAPRALAQLATEPPRVNAENETWYVSGAPINLGGTIYYPSGPVTHFNRNEMVFTGVFERIPVYKRTTQEPGSIVYVPLAGGLVRPYERRRSGDLAGTVGSSAPSFPIALPAAEATQAASGPAFFGAATPVIPRPVGTSGFLYGTAVTEPRPAATVEKTVPPPTGTSGVDGAVLSTAPMRAMPAHIETLQRPVGLNSMFIQFDGVRWYADGPAVEFASDRFNKIGEYRGFAVYEENGRKERIFITPVPGDPALIVPYRSR